MSNSSRSWLTLSLMLAILALAACGRGATTDGTETPAPAATVAPTTPAGEEHVAAPTKQATASPQGDDEPTPPAPTSSSTTDGTADGTTDGTMDESVGENRTPNRLINEKSPYLLQHAYNPIDWYPWGEEAFEKARRENKPIWLSIGYSTCHWCHVMEEESYNDPEVARLMNETFVAIKVDREERPDIDNLYMNVAMLMNGAGGWPLNIIMTPDKKPFFAATYIPKEARFGRVGMLELIPQVQQAWAEQQDELLSLGDRVAAALQPSMSQAGDEPDEETLTLAYDEFAGRFDAVNGGFGDRPKFPSPHNLLFLLRYWARTGNAQALDMVETTLQAMRRGGIYDQVGFGFHRYSTDAEWFLPHFEKMLYDQAIQAMAYTEAFQATGDPQYRRTAEEIFTYALRDMQGPEGGFYSAEDADSEGEEGKFYTWTTAEIRELLEPEDAALAIQVYGMTDEGNFDDEAGGGKSGANVLALTAPLDDLATQADLSEEELAGRLERIRQVLFQAREKRIHPFKDDKTLTDWNGLMISALARGAQAFDAPEYADAASRAADFILGTMVDEDGRLLHRYREGEASIPATVDDYAFFIAGLLDLYEATFDIRYLTAARDLNDQFVEHFWDESEGGFFVTADDAEALLIRQKEVYDGAIPSGNSVAMMNQVRLGRMTGDPTYAERAAALSRAFAAQVAASPSGFAQLLSAVDFAIGPSREIVIVGEADDPGTQAMLRALRGYYLPKKVILLRTPGDDAPIANLAEFTRYQYSLDGQPTVYVCRNFECEFPTTDVGKMVALLEKP